MPGGLVTQYCAHLQQLIKKVRMAIRELDQSNDLTFIRIRTQLNEIMIAPGKYRCVKRTIVLCSA